MTFPQYRRSALQTAFTALIRYMLQDTQRISRWQQQPWPVALPHLVYQWLVSVPSPTVQTYAQGVAALLQPSQSLYSLIRRAIRESQKWPQMNGLMLGQGLWQEMIQTLSERRMDHCINQALRQKQYQLSCLLKVIRWAGARVTDVLPGMLIQQLPGNILCFKLLGDKIRRMRTRWCWIPGKLFLQEEMTVLQDQIGKPWALSFQAWKADSEIHMSDHQIYMQDHESWRRVRMVELTQSMTRPSLQTYMSISKCLDTYLRGLACQLEDKPQQWFSQL